MSEAKARSATLERECEELRKALETAASDVVPGRRELYGT
jgi:hypothetical protein